MHYYEWKGWDSLCDDAAAVLLVKESLGRLGPCCSSRLPLRQAGHKRGNDRSNGASRPQGRKVGQRPCQGTAIPESKSLLSR